MDLTIRRRAVERILEDETLASDLIDPAAEILLDWGVAQAKVTAQQAGGMSQAELDTRLAALRRTMKRISRQAGGAAPEAQAERVRALLAEIEGEQNVEAEHGA